MRISQFVTYKQKLGNSISLRRIWIKVEHDPSIRSDLYVLAPWGCFAWLVVRWMDLSMWAYRKISRLWEPEYDN